jgi:hypothetical protein
MNGLDYTLLIERASQELSDTLRPRFREFEREQDRLLAELRSLSRTLKRHQVTEALLLEREARLAELSTQAEQRARELVQMERLYATTPRPSNHDHPTDAGAAPVIVFDLHRTLTTSHGYPLGPPFEGVKEALDDWASQGVCLHLCTAALEPRHDPLILAARLIAAWAWIDQCALPIKWVAGKVGAHTYYDDRMVCVEPDGNWDRVRKAINVELDARSEVGPDGIRRLIALGEIGDPYQKDEWPDPDSIPPDQPRGFSTPILDVDVHRCLSQANSSQNLAPPMPGAKEALTKIWEAGFTIHFSCAGWDPTTHTPEEAAQRLAGLQQMVRKLGLPYDQFVSKDHGTCFVDDKGFPFTSWKKDFPALSRRLGAPLPDDEITASAHNA